MSGRHLRAAPAPVEDDPYGLDDPAYDINRFYTRASDEKGGSSLSIRQIWVPGEILSRMDAVVASKRIPDYKRSQDIVRDALFHRLWWLENVFKVDAFDDALRLWSEEDAAMKLLSNMRSTRRSIERRREVLDEAVKNSDRNSLRQGIESAEILRDTLEDPYRAEMSRVIDEYAEKYRRL